MNYSLGYAFTADDLFENFPYKKLKFDCKKCFDITGNRHRDILVKKIFKEGVRLVLNDIIDNNATFELPLRGNKKCDIHMQRVSGEEFKTLRNNGKWKDVDYLKSLFAGYRLGFYMYGNRTPRIKYIYVDKELRNKIIENTNKGKQYC